MENQHYSRVTYDMPQEQLSYFDTRAKSSQSTAPSSVARTSVSRREEPNQRSDSQRVRQGQREYDDGEPKLAAQKGSLSDQFHQYFAGPPRDTAAARQVDEESAATSVRSQKPLAKEKPAQASYPTQKPVILQVRQSAAPQNPRASAQNASGDSTHQYPARCQRDEAASTDSRAQNEAHDDVFYWSHDAPSTSSQRSATNEPREPTIPASSATRDNRCRVVQDEELPSTPQNDYSQPKGDRQAPLRKSSIPRGTPMSYRSDSAASFDEEAPSQRLQRPYIPRGGEAIHPVRQPAARQTRPQRAEHQGASEQATTANKRDDEVEKLREEEENCTFQPHINDGAECRGHNFQDSPRRGSEGTNPPRDSRGDYGQAPFDKLYADAEAARRASKSRQMQKKAEEAELEINEKFGPRSTAVNPRRSAVERDATQEEVFARLYADAQRYNREKTEQERLLEEKRQEERCEGPFDWNKGRDKKAAAAEDGEAGGDEKPAPQPRRSLSMQKPPKNMDVFLRLARPNSITLSFQKQKELEEQEKHMKEQQEQEQKKTEMEKIAEYNWDVPAKSFTFADLESQNAMYVS